jgi:hypothetical protein
MLHHRRSITIMLMAMFALCATASAQPAPVRLLHENIAISSGVHDGGPEEAIVFVHVFARPSAPWMRLHVSDAHLGQHSFVVLRSMADNGEQRLDTVSLEQWQNATAIFNGDRVMLELHVMPGDEGVFVEFDQMVYGEAHERRRDVDGDGDDDGGIATMCGADNRVASSDNRVGRLYFGGCTAWRTTAGIMLTAGHCVDFDPDQGGSAVPDGVLDLSGVVEFNVPASDSDGSTNAADPDDQYPILNITAWQFAGSTPSFNSIGSDWGAFRVGPNSNTGLMPEEAYGMPFRLTREVPAEDTTLRITGFGSDSGTTNFTNQTSTGPFLEEIVNSSTDIELRYQVDTEGGNSGSPVIWNSLSLAIGIHTNAGCESDGGGSNAGTSFEHNTLETWISEVAGALYGIPGGSVRYVDINHPLRVSESGTPYRPYSTFNLGASGVPSGGLITIVAGNYTAAAGNTGTYGTGNKAMLLVAPTGTVTIGN